MTTIDFIAPVLVGLLWIAVSSLVAEPGRQRLNAVMVAGAGAAYLSGGGLGLWEIPFTVAVTVCAYRGLTNYAWLGVGWLLHTAWDVVHHVTGHPIIPELAHSSFGCAICDPVIALWMFRGAPPVQGWFRTSRGRVSPRRPSRGRRRPTPA